MITRACSNCRHWNSGRCKSQPPTALTPEHSVWPMTSPDDWCGRFALINQSAGQPPKVTDEALLAMVRELSLPLTGADGREVRPMAYKRSMLINQLVELGMTRTPAVKRIQKLIRHGLLEQGPDPWGGAPGIYLWTSTPDTPTPTPEVAPADRLDRFVAQLREICPTPERATSLRAIVRLTTPTVALATASRWINRLIETNRVGHLPSGYFLL